MRGWQPYVPGRSSAYRFLQADRETILVTPGNQRRACGRTHSGIGVGLGEFHPFERKSIHVRRCVIALAVATHIGKAEVVGEDEDDVWPGGLSAGATQRRRGNGERASRAGQQITAREAGPVWHLVSPSAFRAPQKRGLGAALAVTDADPWLEHTPNGGVAKQILPSVFVGAL